MGYAQWVVLRSLLPGFGKGVWIVATILGAVVAWLLGMIPSTIASLQTQATQMPPHEPPLAMVLLLAAGMGAGGGLVLSFAQWRVLRPYGTGTIWWLPANALAWAIAMPWIFWLVRATVGEQQTPVAFLLFFAGLGVSGAIVGAVHGVFLVRLIAPRWHAAPPLNHVV